MKTNLKEKLNNLLNYLFVEDCSCLICSKEIVKDSRYSICDKCLKSLPYITKSCSKCGESIDSGTLCLNCKNDLPIVTKNISVFEYTNPISNLITDLKYKNKKYLAKYLSSFIVDKFIESGMTIDFVIPVPISKERLKLRGFNQAELLCAKFKDINIEIKNNLVTRLVNTPNQTSLSRKERLVNLKNVFMVEDKSLITGKTILIVDDVYTTGATINEIASVLFKAHAKAVYGITLAHSKYETIFEENN